MLETDIVLFKLDTTGNQVWITTVVIYVTVREPNATLIDLERSSYFAVGSGYFTLILVNCKIEGEVS